MSVTISPLRQRDIYEMVGTTSPFPFVGLCGRDENGQILGLGGLVLQDGKWIAGLHLQGDKRAAAPVALMKAAKSILRAARASGLRVVAICDQSLPRSAEFLVRLGFRPTGLLIAGETEWVLEG